MALGLHADVEIQKKRKYLHWDGAMGGWGVFAGTLVVPIKVEPSDLCCKESPGLSSPEALELANCIGIEQWVGGMGPVQPGFATIKVALWSLVLCIRAGSQNKTAFRLEHWDRWGPVGTWVVTFKVSPCGRKLWSFVSQALEMEDWNNCIGIEQ